MLRKLAFVLAILTITAAATERQSNADYHTRRQALAKAMSADHGSLILFAPVEPEGQNDLYGFRQENQLLLPDRLAGAGSRHPHHFGPIQGNFLST